VGSYGLGNEPSYCIKGGSFLIRLLTLVLSKHIMLPRVGSVFNWWYWIQHSVDFCNMLIHFLCSWKCLHCSAENMWC